MYFYGIFFFIFYNHKLLQIRYPTRTRTYLWPGSPSQDAFLEYEAVYVIVVRSMGKSLHLFRDPYNEYNLASAGVSLLNLLPHITQISTTFSYTLCVFNKVPPT